MPRDIVYLSPPRSVKNRGTIEHDLSIAPLEEDGAHAHEKVEHLAQTRLLKQGDSQVITFIAEEAGEYVYHCTVPGHPELGMKGQFIITE